MNPPLQLKSVTCTSCGDVRIFGPDEMANQLRAIGKLRRDAKPDAQFIIELFFAELSSNNCQRCHKNDFVVSAYEMDEDDWGDPVLCEVCKQEIPPERLEIFPNEKRCAGCKDKPEIDSDEPEFCSFCGGLMTVRQRGGAGIMGYVMACTECGRKS